MIDEFRLYRSKSGHPDWPRLASEARALAREILPTLEKPRSRRADIRRKAGSYRTVAQNYLDNRKHAKAGREDLRPLYFIWTTLRSCNFSCTYCDDHQGHKYPDLPDDGVLNTEQGIRLLEIMRTKTPSVYFAGGEPTMRQDLPMLTRAARDLRYYPIIINTNASLIHRWLKKDSWKTWLADTDFIVVSLDALDLRHRRSHSLTAEIAFFSLCLVLGGFNDWNTVVRHRVYNYTVPSDLLPWSSIPSWMLIYWGMILRFMATLSGAAWFQADDRPQNPPTPPFVKGGPRGDLAKWKLPIQLALVFSTRQCIYRFYENPLISWLPFAASLALYLILFPPTRAEWRFVGLLAVGGPLMESLYIRVGHLHHYSLGWIGGVPVWIALWWILAGLIWKDLSPRILTLIAKAFPAGGEACG